MKKILVVSVHALRRGRAATATAVGTPSRAAGAKKPLYWVDPMHPWYKSDVPGIAPDCDMKLVPVYPARKRATSAAPTDCRRAACRSRRRSSN